MKFLTRKSFLCLYIDFLDYLAYDDLYSIREYLRVVFVNICSLSI